MEENFFADHACLWRNVQGSIVICLQLSTCTTLAERAGERFSKLLFERVHVHEKLPRGAALPIDHD